MNNDTTVVSSPGVAVMMGHDDDNFDTSNMIWLQMAEWGVVSAKLTFLSLFLLQSALRICNGGVQRAPSPILEAETTKNPT